MVFWIGFWRNVLSCMKETACGASAGTQITVFGNELKNFGAILNEIIGR